MDQWLNKSKENNDSIEIEPREWKTRFNSYERERERERRG